MIRGSKSDRAYVTGLQDAHCKGKKAANDPKADQSANPYKRVEHRLSWSQGFAERRKELAR